MLEKKKIISIKKGFHISTRSLKYLDQPSRKFKVYDICRLHADHRLEIVNEMTPKIFLIKVTSSKEFNIRFFQESEEVHVAW